MEACDCPEQQSARYGQAVDAEEVRARICVACSPDSCHLSVNSRDADPSIAVLVP